MRKRLNIGSGRLVSVASNEWLIRFISLLLAVVLWSLVGREHRIDKNVMIPVEIINLPQNLVISNQYKKEIEVSVSGPRSSIAEMEKEVVRQVDLAEVLPGTLVVENSNDTISVPREVTVKRIQPSSIILSLDRLIKKDVPIEVRTIGKVGDGYFLTGKMASPQSISITGPGTVLAKVDKIFTRPVELTGKIRSVRLQAPLELSSQLVDLIGETSVTVQLKVMPDAAETTIKNVPVEAFVNKKKVAVEPAVVQVKAMVPKVALAGKKDLRSLVRAVAEEGGSDGELQVTIVSQQMGLPVEVMGITPPKVRLKERRAAGETMAGKKGELPLLRKEKRKKKKQ